MMSTPSHHCQDIFSRILLFNVLLWSAVALPMLLDNNMGKFKQCSSEFPCPENASCLDYPWLEGVKVCYNGTNFTRPGTCPPARPGGQVGAACFGDSDCPPGNQKCCPSLEKDSLFCQHVNPKRSSSVHLRVTVLIEGKREPGKMLQGTVTLVQSKGKNILVDQGTVGQKVQLIERLWDENLHVNDIDYVIQTHGHLDHYSNGNLFLDKIIHFDTQVVLGSNILTKVKLPFNIFDDKNLELISTKGHTMQDTSLIVRNVSHFGTVAIVGDLIGNENETDSDWESTAQAPAKQRQNRRKISCLADYIVPGHGPMFKVSEKYKSDADCKNLANNAIRSCLHSQVWLSIMYLLLIVLGK